jgi:hypothetical protein
MQKAKFARSKSLAAQHDQVPQQPRTAGEGKTMSIKSERKKQVYEEKKNTVAVIPIKPALPHYTAEKVVELLNSNDSRYGTAQAGRPGSGEEATNFGGTPTP